MFSGYVRDIEEKPSSTPWGSKMPFANLMAEFSNSLNVSLYKSFPEFDLYFLLKYSGVPNTGQLSSILVYRFLQHA